MGNLTITNGATLTVNSGVTLTITGTLTIQGSSTINASGATINISNNLAEAWDSGSPNTINGGTFTIGGNFTVSGGGTFNVDAIDLTVSGSMTMDGGTILNLTNGSQIDITGDASSSGGGQFNIDDSDVMVGGNFDNSNGRTLNVNNSGTIQVGGDFNNASGGNTSASGGGGIIVDGNYNNSGSGSTDVSGGGLSVGGSYSGPPTNNSGSGCDPTAGCCGTACSTLPVELIYFSLTSQEKGIIAQWATATEINNDYFTIERSQDSRRFDKITQVDGQGTTDEQQEYHYVDQVNTSGIFYYRLSQTDFDGTTTLFDVKAVYVNPGKDLTKVVVYPSSIKPGMSLQISSSYSTIEEYNVQLFDIAGKKYQLDLRKSDKTITVKPMRTNLNPGMYNLQIMINQKAYTRKIIVE